MSVALKKTIKNLLDCHRNDNTRDEMLNIINRYSNVTSDILLFGKADSCKCEDFFKAVNAYVRKTKRFMSFVQ